MLKIFCKNTGTFQEFQEGTTLLEMLPAFDFERPYDILSAKVNNVSEGLKFRVFNNRDVEFLDYRSYNGRNVYCRSLSFLLCKAVRDLYPDFRVVLRRPISKGYYCNVDKPDGSAVTEEETAAIRDRMTELVQRDIPFRRHEVQISEAIRIFRRLGLDDKVKLLRTCGDVYITYYTLQDTADYFYDALVPSTGLLKVWALSTYRGGMLLRVPDRHTPDELAPFLEQPKTFDVFSEALRWNRIMDLDNVGDVNYAWHQLPEPVRMVLITGPTSSGKSTFCKRLSVQLKACGLHPVSFSTDDYFVNRVDTPKFPDGSYDFDNFETVDHDYLQEDVLQLLAGEEVEVPEYNFVTGKREFNGKKLQLDDRSILLIEGIHALNPQLTDLVPEASKFRIFINTITSLSLDDHNCIPTSDNRLLRRIVRDYNKGAFTARESISHWQNVLDAEKKWIYPFQETADAMFNSAYLIEFAVLKNHAEPILRSVPQNCPEYAEAHRLLKFIHYFTPVPDKEIPATSLLREFIGG